MGIDTKEAIDREQLRLVMQQLPAMQAASVVVALVLSYAVRGSIRFFPGRFPFCNSTSSNRFSFRKKLQPFEYFSGQPKGIGFACIIL